MIVLSFLSALLAVRLYSVGSFRGFVRLRLARQLIVFTLLDSWLFCWASAVILFGVGSALNHTACEIGIWWCIACMSKRCPKLAGNEADIPWLNLAVYASSKAMIYCKLWSKIIYVCTSLAHPTLHSVLDGASQRRALQHTTTRRCDTERSFPILVV